MLVCFFLPSIVFFLPKNSNFLGGVQPSNGIAIGTALISHESRLESASGPINDDQGSWPCSFGVSDLDEPWNPRISDLRIE